MACTYDKATITVYVNGISVDTQAETDAPDDTAASFEIGEDDSADAAYGNLAGTVDDFKFYTYARSAAQINEDLRGTGYLGLSQAGAARGGMIAWWDFDEGTGTLAHDRSGNGNNGTLTSMSSPATATSGWSQSGKFGRALNFDGSDDYVSVVDSSSTNIGTGSFTINMFIKSNAIPPAGAYPIVITKRTNSNWVGWAAYQRPSSANK